MFSLLVRCSTLRLLRYGCIEMRDMPIGEQEGGALLENCFSSCRVVLNFSWVISSRFRIIKIRILLLFLLIIEHRPDTPPHLYHPITLSITLSSCMFWMTKALISLATALILLLVLPITLKRAQFYADWLVSWVDFCLINFGENGFGNVSEDSIDILSWFGGALHEHEPISFGAIEPLVVWDCSPGWMEQYLL